MHPSEDRLAHSDNRLANEQLWPGALMIQLGGKQLKYKYKPLIQQKSLTNSNADNTVGGAGLAWLKQEEDPHTQPQLHPKLFHKEKMLVGTWHPSEALRAARESRKHCWPSGIITELSGSACPGLGAQGCRAAGAEQMAATWP